MSSGGGASPVAGSPFAGTALGGLLPALFSGAGMRGSAPTFGGGMFGNPGVGSQFMPMPQNPNAQYQASPAAQNQIQSLLSGTAGGGGMGAAPGALSPFTTFGKYSGALTPGIQAAMGAGGSGVPGGGNPQYGGVGALLGGPVGMVLGNMFEKNNSQIQDIAGALYQGLPITDADWRNAGFGPGGIPLGGQ